MKTRFVAYVRASVGVPLTVLRNRVTSPMTHRMYRSSVQTIAWRRSNQVRRNVTCGVRDSRVRWRMRQSRDVRLMNTTRELLSLVTSDGV